MQLLFRSPDLAILPVLRRLEQRGFGGEWKIEIGDMEAGKDIAELGPTMAEYLLSQTRFGRIALIEEPHSPWASSYKDLLTQDYKPTDKRAEAGLQLTNIKAPGLSALAAEGLGDSVEFRRLARKYVRQAKSAHCDVIFTSSPFFADGRTQKVLQHIAGTQIKVCTWGDVVEGWGFEKDESPASYTFINVDIAEKSRCEYFLQRKLKDEAFGVE